MQTGRRSEQEEFLINELANLAGVTVRTIRYYTDEGLLPQPETRGKYAYYNRGHLHRLELIRRMKETYLPLREIRDVIQRMSDKEVQQQLRATSEDAPSSQKSYQVSESKTSALDYIARVRGRQSDLRTPEKDDEAILPSRLPAAQPPGMPVGKIIILEDDPPEEHWRRIEIAAGVELHLREPVDPSMAAAIEHFIREIKQNIRKRKQGE
jgi:DNA-binding transcriptional MerR regulator